MDRNKTFHLFALLLIFSLLFTSASSGASATGPQAPVQVDLTQSGEPSDPLAPTTSPVFPFIQDNSGRDVDIDLRLQSPGLSASTGADKPLEATSAYTVTLGAWRNLRPTESYLRGVSMLPSNDSVDCTSPDQRSKGWIVGDGGVILSYCNGVWDHAIIVESVPTTLMAVQAINPQLGVAVGDQGAVLMYLWDRIAKDWIWTKSPIPVGNQLLYGVSMVEDGSGGYTGWAVGDKDINGRGTLVQGKITPTVIDGQATYQYTWNNLTSSFQSLPQVDFYFGVQMLSPTNGWASGGKDGSNGKGVILHWDGTQWTVFQEIGTHALLGLFMRSATDGWAVGSGGVIYHFNGITWSPVDSPTHSTLVNVGFSSTSDGWIVGGGGVLLKYVNGNWMVFNDLRTDPFDFWGLDFTSGHGWLVGFRNSIGMGGDILEYVDGLWLAVTPPTDNQLNDLAVVSDNSAWAVGKADSSGGTIIHWDGKHWQRWFQRDLPLPAVDLYAIDMLSDNNGWAAGDPPKSGAPSVFLHWDGHRWAEPRYDAPLNLRVNDLAMLKDQPHGTLDFGWAVADNGNAVAKYDGFSAFWSANHSCQGVYYSLRGTSIVTDTNTFSWDAWAVGTSTNPATGEYFLRYMPGCAGSYAWEAYQHPPACSDNIGGTILQGIQMRPGTWGFAVGDNSSRASIFSYTDETGKWTTALCEPPGSNNPSRFYSTDIVKASNVGWFGGYYSSQIYHRKVAYLVYKDGIGFGWAGTPFPLNGKNIYDRPVKSLKMSSDTMGWAVGDPEDGRRVSVIYQYPYPNFTLNSTPPSQAVLPGGVASYSVDVNSIGGFSANVNLQILDLPPGVTANISPAAIQAGTPAAIQLTTSQATPLGSYDVPLLGYAIFRSGDNNIPVWRVSYLHLNVTNHPLYSVNPTQGPANTLVTINGANFGADPGAGNRSTDANHVELAGQRLPDSAVVAWSNNQVQFRPPDTPSLFLISPADGFPFIGQVKVTAGGSNSNDDLTFQLENQLDSYTTVQGTATLTVTVTGTSLGVDPGGLFRSTSYEHVSLGGSWITNSSVLSWGNNAITFVVPKDILSGLLTVTSNGFESNALTFIPPGSQGSGKTLFLPIARK